MAEVSARPLRGRVAIVTGASAGIGRATAQRLARDGAAVFLAARRQERLVEVAAEICSQGGVAYAVPLDIGVAADRERIVDEALSRFQRIDILINNAGFGQLGPVEYIPLDRIREAFETNLFGLVALTQLVVPVMRRQRGGRIVNVSSVAGRIARPLSAVYDATKHALEAISDGMRLELAPFNIQVVVLELGFVQTEFHSSAVRNGVPDDREDVYAPVLASQAAAYARMRRLAGRPEDVARLMARIVKVSHPSPRYAAPGFAHVALLLKRLLPDRVLDRLLR